MNASLNRNFTCPPKKFNPEERKRTLLPLLRCTTAIINAGSLAPLYNRVILELHPSKHKNLALATVHQLAAALSTLVVTPKCAKNVRMTCAVADALLALLHASAISTSLTTDLALTALLQCLQFPYPCARVYISERLYGTLLELSVSEECCLKQAPLLKAQDILSNAPWDAEDSEGVLKEAVFELAHVLEIKTSEVESPRLKRAAERLPQDELESYSYLVKDAGY